MAEFILKDCRGKDKTFDHDTIYVRDAKGKLLSFTYGTGDDQLDVLLDQINGEVIGEELYHITFMSGVELIKVPVYEGYDCKDPVTTGLIEEPTKESTKYISYTFAGWSLTEGGTVDESALSAVEGDRTVYAVFSEDYIYIAKGSTYDPDEGSSNSTIYWTLNPDYVLTVESTGYKTPDYSISSNDVPPWWGYRDQITAVVITGKGWWLGRDMFAGCTNLTSVTFSDKISTINLQAFADCTSLAEVTLPPNTLTIGDYAFKNTSIRSITIPARTKYIYAGAFQCDTLESVVFEKTDGWCYYNQYDSYKENPTIVTEKQAADPTFAVSKFKEKNVTLMVEWVNENV